MSMLMWNPEWETGIWKIDQQHRELLRQIELLMLAIHANEAEGLIPGILTYLAGYVELHFHDEEAEMAAAGYPGLDAHRICHDHMRTQVTRLLIEFQNDPAVVTDEVLDFLTDWLVHHINEEDRCMAHHLLRWTSGQTQLQA